TAAGDGSPRCNPRSERWLGRSAVGQEARELVASRGHLARSDDVVLARSDRLADLARRWIWIERQGRELAEQAGVQERECRLADIWRKPHHRVVAGDKGDSDDVAERVVVVGR